MNKQLNIRISSPQSTPYSNDYQSTLYWAEFFLGLIVTKRFMDKVKYKGIAEKNI